MGIDHPIRYWYMQTVCFFCCNLLIRQGNRHCYESNLQLQLPKNEALLGWTHETFSQTCLLSNVIGKDTIYFFPTLMFPHIKQETGVREGLPWIGIQESRYSSEPPGELPTSILRVAVNVAMATSSPAMSYSLKTSMVASPMLAWLL